MPGRRQPRKSFCYERAFVNKEPEDISSLPSSPTIKKSYRLIILGSSQTGKSCIVKRFLHNKFDDFYSPTIEDFYRKVYKIRGEFHQLDILDTAGNDPYPAARRLLLLTGDVFILVYSVDNPSSYEETFRLYDQIVKLKTEGSSPHSSRTAVNPSKIPVVFVANKIDIEPAKRLVNTDRAHKRIKALNNHVAVLECSALTSEGVSDLFKITFELSRLPKEMSPNYHSKLHETSSLGKLVSRSPLVRLKSKQRSEDTHDRRKKELIEDTNRRMSLRSELFKRKSKRGAEGLTRQAAVTEQVETIPEDPSRETIRKITPPEDTISPEQEKTVHEAINNSWGQQMSTESKNSYVPPPNPNDHLYLNPQMIDSTNRRIGDCKIF